MHFVIYLRYLFIEFDFVIACDKEKANILTFLFHSYGRKCLREVPLELKVEWKLIFEYNVAFNSNRISSYQFELDKRFVLNFLDFSEVELTLHVRVAPPALTKAFIGHIDANFIEGSTKNLMLTGALEPVIRSFLLFLFLDESHESSELFARFAAR